jgi:hypothetical protein
MSNGMHSADCAKENDHAKPCNCALAPNYLPPREAVNHPAHYGGDTVYETIKVIRAWGLGFDLGNAVKYISRAGKKDRAKTIEDLKKAIFYIEDEIKHLEGATK